MKRREFAVAGALMLFAGTRGRADAQISLDLAPELIKVRASAENDIKQVHQLAQYRTGSASTPPVNLVAIDGQYDDLVAAVNGYVLGLAAAVQLPRPLDDKKWKTEGDVVVAQAQKFDGTLQQLKMQAGTSAEATRGAPFLTTFASILGQIVLPGSTLFQNTKKAADQSSADDKKAAAVVLQSALWRDSATVLGLAPTAARPQARST